MFATVPVLVDVDGDRLERAAACERPSLEPPDRRLHRRRLHARCLDDDVRGQCGARERLLHPVVGLDHLDRLGERVGPLAARRSCSAGRASATSNPPATITDTTGRRRTRSTIAPQIRPSPSSRRRRPTNGTRARVDVVAEPREHSGKHGQRPEHGDGDDENRGQRQRREGRVARQEHAGHRHHHGQARDEDRAAGGRGRDLERRPLAAPRRAFLPFALQVEQRVVDADGEPDQEHHRRGLHARPAADGSRAQPGRTSRTRRSGRARAECLPRRASRKSSTSTISVIGSESVPALPRSSS